MAIRFSEDGGISGFFEDAYRSLGSRQSRIGDILEVKSGQALPAPPRGTMWHQPHWAGGLYQLNDLAKHPVLEVGDKFGIHPEDPIPLPPSGTILERVHNPKMAVGKSAVVYRVSLPPEMSMVLALPRPKPPTLDAHAVLEFPQRQPGKRWQPVYVDGRNLQPVGIRVAA
jgi:hypothetical protein